MFIFEERTFLTGEVSDEELNDEDIEFIKGMRGDYPELSHWSNAGVYFAFGAYSQDIYAVGWLYGVKSRENGFLAYCYVCQLCPDFDFGGTGLYDTDTWELGEQQPWNKEKLLRPSWACR